MNSEISSAKISRRVILAVLTLSLIGFVDASYLTAEYFSGGEPYCSFLEGCSTVTQSKYAAVGPIPVSLLGLLFYISVFFSAFIYKEIESKLAFKFLLLLASAGFAVSLLLTYIQAFVLDAYCIYCITSAVISTLIFILVLSLRKKLI